ncbi:MAG: metallophosphoesterase [Mediterranea sp.]|jgi:predicted MPP superfamily phosphohydrolase|nr:metallophosphoesterase [Mediterranea sp.]
MKPVYVVLMIVFFLGVNSYVFYRLAYMLPGVGILRGVVAAAGVVVVLSFFGYFLGRDLFPPGVGSFMYAVGSSWMFMMVYFLILFLLLDVLRVIPGFPAGFIFHGNLAGFALVVGLVAAVFVYGHLKYRNKERVELSLAVDKPCGRAACIKIVALSDLHLGSRIGRDELAEWVELVNRERPDVVLIAGDIVDFDVRPLYDQGMAEVFRRIRSKYGVYAVMGNHEYIAGAGRCAEFFDSAGICLLRDTFVLVDDAFYIVGRDDRSRRRRKPVGELTGPLDRSKPVILLDHQPFELEVAAAHGVDLQISGHTHRGQVWPISWITDAVYEVSHGYRRKGDTHFYVSSGIGLWGGKFRIGTQSEYMVIGLGTGK